MKDVHSSDADEQYGLPDYGAMAKCELEDQTVAAIREYRRLIAADEAVYAEWLRVDEDPSAPDSVRLSMQAEYLARQKRSERHQNRLAAMIDALGYVPEVPEASTDPD